ncbi:MAG: NADH-quinone oxidoreductase subunit J [Chloroflexi bacterium]|nr:NADH-quinone oxidoreductase subunit J [Chloroflexota bacterium]
MTAQDIVFWLLAGGSISAAVMVVTVKNIFRAAVLLATTFMTVAGLFVLLNADFLAVVQVLIYIGAISILLVFAALLTQEPEAGNASNRLRPPALLGAVAFMAFIAATIVRTNWSLMEETLSEDTLARVQEVLTHTPQWLAGLLLQEWVLPFEVASVLLLAAVIGALVLVRERHP